MTKTAAKESKIKIDLLILDFEEKQIIEEALAKNKK